ncbi:MAG TPA: DMT family transporter [Casimicrobiaceae bacterium]
MSARTNDTGSLLAQGRPVAHPLRRALPLFLLAGLCLSSLDATAKYLVRDHPLLLVVWARYAGQMVVVTPYAWHRAGHGFWRTRSLRMQLVRSAFLLAATVGFFAGLRYLPLAEASSITFMAPMIVVALSLPVLGERPTRARIVASLAGFTGILVLARPGSSVLHPAVVFLVITAVCNALYQLYTRKLREENPHTMLFYSALVGAIGATIVLPFLLEETIITAKDAGLLMLSGVFAGLGHGLMIGAYSRAPASQLAPFTYLQMVWATLFGAVFFGQHPDAVSALGMAVIMASGIALALWERRRARLL